MIVRGSEDARICRYLAPYWVNGGNYALSFIVLEPTKVPGDSLLATAAILLQYLWGRLRSA